MKHNRVAIKTLIMVILLTGMVCAFACAGYAEPDGTSVIQTEETTKPETVSMDINTEQAAEVFVDRIMKGTRMRGVTMKGASLTGANKILYDKLKEDITAVANGAEGCNGSTVFIYALDEIYSQTNFTSADLGTTIVENNAITTAATKAVKAKYAEELSFSAVTDCLQNDCSFELYWYDKTVGSTIQDAYHFGASWENGAYELNVSGQVTVCFTVSQDYAVITDNDDGSYSLNPYQVDVEKYGSAVAAAVQNARNIVNAHETEGNYRRLLSYKTAICRLTDYNHPAADDDNNTPYGNPWQLVWVFDGNPETTVVCEGYSKAFRYLNELSSNNQTDVFLAEGTMAGGTGEGPHMWNVVRMDDGKNYMADITNSDAGSIGVGGELFLKGYTSKNGSAYVFVIDEEAVSYTYESEVIEIESKDYEPTDGSSGYDTTAPKLNSVSITPATLAQGEALQVGLDLTETETGITFIEIMYKAAADTGDQLLCSQSYDSPISSGMQSFSIAISEEFDPGSYIIDDIRLKDYAGNTVHYGYDADREYMVAMETGTFIPIEDGTDTATITNGFTITGIQNQVCEHNWENGVCTICGEECSHYYPNGDGICGNCGYHCPHTNKETTETTETEYEWASTTRHNVLTVTTSHYRCNDCGYTSTPERTITEQSEDHTDTNEDDICDICLRAISGSYDWSVNNGVLRITGNGATPDYQQINNLPWYGQLGSIQRVFIEGDFTVIGTNVLKGLGSETRIDFRQRKMPTINDAATITGVCRYYSTDASWNNAPTGWVYLPVFNPDWETMNQIEYHAETGWSTGRNSATNNIDYPLNNRQAWELAYTGRNVFLYSIPKGEALKVITEHFDTTWMINLQPGCTGEWEIEIPENCNSTLNFDVNAPNLELAIDGSKIEKCNRLLVITGTVEYTGDIQDLYLRNGTQGGTASLTVNGDVNSMSFYDKTSDAPYAGSVTVNGKIVSGTAYGTVTMAIPNISDEVVFPNMVKATMSNVEQPNSPVIQNGKLNVATAQTIDGLTYEDFDLTYHLYNDGWRLFLSPKEGSGLGMYSADIDDIEKYNPTFSTDDIIYGENTDIYVSGVREIGKLSFTGGSNGEGLRDVTFRACIAEISCPVSRLNVSQLYTDTEATTVTIKGPVEELWMELRKSGNTVTLGQGGSVGGGLWNRYFGEDRYFGAITIAGDIYSDDQLKVLSWKDGQELKALLPSDSEVTTAAGVTATVDINESSVDELTDKERSTLNTFLNGQGTIAAVFDATVSPYTENEEGGIIRGNPITTQLNESIPITVSNDTGEECYIVRLHQDGDTVTPAQLTQPSADNTIPFSSNLFSKYVIVKTGEAVQHPIEYVYSGVGAIKTLTITGNGTMENYSAAAPAPWAEHANDIDLIVIGEGITRIGANAFANMSKTVRVDFLEEEKPEIDDTAFAGTSAIFRRYTNGAGTNWPEDGTTANGNGHTIQWIYIPAYIMDGMDGNIRRVEYRATDGWGISVFNNQTAERDLIPMSVAQIREATFGKLKAIDLYAIPNTSDIYEGWTQVQSLCLEPGCEGTLNNVTIPENSVLSVIEMRSGTASLNIKDLRQNGLYKLISCNGSVTYDGKKIHQAILQECSKTNNDLVHVTGNIEELHFHDSTAQYPYRGSLQVDGTVIKGYVRGNQSLEIPGADPINFNDMVTASFENADPDDHMIIQNGTLKPDTTSVTVSLDMFTLRYYFFTFENRLTVNLALWPKYQYQATLGSDQIYRSDLNIQPSEICYGDDTYVSIQTTVADEDIVFGKRDEETNEWTGSLAGIDLMYGYVVVNIPVRSINMSNARELTEGSVLTINSSVTHMTISDLKAGSVSLGTNGTIQNGNWTRRNGDRRNFGGVRYADTENGTVYSDGSLRVMSWKEGQSLKAMLPSDNSVTAAAGGQKATADVNESSEEALTPQEEAALNTFLAEHGDGAALAVFDATVRAYTEDENGNITLGNPITQLGTEIPITVSNDSGKKCYIVRLHTEGNTVRSEQLTNATDDPTIPFTSDLFSKYVIVRDKSECESFSEPEEISIEVMNDQYHSILISLPWQEGANVHNISVYNMDGSSAYDWSNCNWGPNDMQADKCMFQINIVQGGQNRRMDPGEYYAVITLKGDDHKTTTFRRNFIVAGTGYQFTVFRIPSATKTIEDETFTGIPANMVCIPAACSSIGSNAFGTALKAVYIPNTGTITIADTAFPKGTLIYTPKNSSAASWAKNKGYQVIYQSTAP